MGIKQILSVALVVGMIPTSGLAYTFSFADIGKKIGQHLSTVALPAAVKEQLPLINRIRKQITQPGSLRYERPLRAQHRWPLTLPQPSILGRMLAQLTEDRYPRQFLWGAITTEHTHSHECSPGTCANTLFAVQTGKTLNSRMLFPVDLWNHYQPYIQDAKKQLGITSLQISLEWALIQPSDPDHWDTAALDHYADLITTLITHGITPVISFFHDSMPVWFAQENGFEDTRNISYFVQFCAKSYEHIMTRIAGTPELENHLPLWITFTDPEQYVIHAYGLLTLPPGRPDKQTTRQRLQVLRVLCETHTRTYHALHEHHTRIATNLPAPRVGIGTSIREITDSKLTRNSWTQLPTRITQEMEQILLNELVTTFFATGHFKTGIPGISPINYHNPQAPQSVDFISLSYHSDTAVPDPATMQPFTYPRGLYRAISETSQRVAKPLNIPLYLSEQGIATDDESERATFYHHSFYALYRAIKEGHNVRGYFVWALADGYEMDSDQSTDEPLLSAGLCTVCPDDPTQLQLKEGAHPYAEMISGYHAERDAINHKR